MAYLGRKGSEAGETFPSSTKMLFQQTSAPTGWTKVTSSNDVALRVVSGSVGSGGTVDFETAFASKTPTITMTNAAVTLDGTTVPNHSHGLTLYDDHNAGSSTGERVTVHGSGYYQSKTGMGGVGATTGGGNAHTHTNSAASSAIDLDVKYVDTIIATKD